MGALRPKVTDAEIEAASSEALAPFSTEGGENPYTVHGELQDVMQDLVGIIRTESELIGALQDVNALRDRIEKLSVEGPRRFNPGWNLSIDLRNMLLVSEAVAMAALERKESRGGHTRDDYPMTDYDFWGKLNVIVELDEEGRVSLRHQPLPEPPPELAALLEDHH
jgi:succinate dehydrogenase / fumarate reductase, flavoprotein subunit